MRACALGVTVWFALCGLAQAQPSCGEPPRVDDLTLKGDLEGKAQFLSKLVGDADLKGKIETARTDIFSKYPNAGGAHSDAYLEYMFCSFVLSDPKLSGKEKFQAILDFRQAEREPVRPSPTATTHGDQSPAVNNEGDTTINYGASQPPATRSPAAPAPRAPTSPSSASTQGNQSPAINSDGNVGINYGPSPPAPAH
jgi:hypothetical protein